MAWLAVLAVLVAPAFVPLARADTARAQAVRHYQRGRQMFDAGAYRGAIGEFQTADGLVPSPLLDFNIALCYDRLGNRREALIYYRRYLRRVPNARNRAAVKARIAALAAARPPAGAAASGVSAGGNAAGGGAAAPRATETPAKGSAKTGGGAANAGPATAGATNTAAQPSTSPPPAGSDLARVARIDVGRIRDQRKKRMERAAAATTPATPVGPAASHTDEPEPAYKKWWFWVIAVGAAVVVVDIAASNSRSSNTPAAAGAAPTAGAAAPVLFRF